MITLLPLAALLVWIVLPILILRKTTRHSWQRWLGLFVGVLVCVGVAVGGFTLISALNDTAERMVPFLNYASVALLVMATAATASLFAMLWQIDQPRSALHRAALVLYWMFFGALAVHGFALMLNAALIQLGSAIGFGVMMIVGFFSLPLMVLALLALLAAFLWIAIRHLSAPALWLCGMVALLLAGSFIALTLAGAGIDRAYHDTYYVIAHWHYVLSICAVCAAITALFVFLERGKHPYPRLLAKLQFWLMAIGTALIFTPQFMLSRARMPRRYVDYPEAFAYYNALSGIGTLICAASLALLIWILIATVLKRRAAPG